MVSGARGMVLIVEGGGDGRLDLKVECRRAFRLLLEQAGLRARMPQIIAAGGRQSAYDLFVSRWTAFQRGGPLPLLLVDSEAPVAGPSAWAHVGKRQGDRWSRPAGAGEEHLHFMVECMEAWFLADRAAVKAFFGKELREGSLPALTARIETIPKAKVYESLDGATKATKKGRYGKGAHSFKLLATLDPAKLRAASPWAERFFATIDRLTLGSSEQAR